jgi:hypothetical protein
MSDDAPLPTAPPPAPSSPPDDQAARIDQLLTAGLDEYFAGRYDGAVQVWSRVFFLDRTNARARAYIERARSAVAERQRVAEASAASAPDVARGWSDEARPAEARTVADPGVLVVSGALAARLAPAQPALERAAADGDPGPTVRRGAKVAHALLVAAAGVLLFVAGYTVAARDRMFEMLSGVSSPRGPAANARASEVALHDARQAIGGRRYDDARRALARIPAGDPLRPEADALVAEIQRTWPIVSPMLAPDAPVRGAGSP